MTDRIETLNGALIQHGPRNDRVYLMKPSGTEPTSDLHTIDRLVAQHRYSKIFAKIPVSWHDAFIDRGYVQEARIPEYYGMMDCCFMASYPEPDRARVSEDEAAQITLVLQTARNRKAASPLTSMSSGRTCRTLTASDAKILAALYGIVFSSYPFPIQDERYIRHTMQNHVVYTGVFEDEGLLAAASAEMDPATKSAEMTDFATRPGVEGNGLARVLLSTMEGQIRLRGIRTYYTIARALSFGMNITFSRCGYSMGGTLIHNTDICGARESMNVWYKAAADLDPTS